MEVWKIISLSKCVICRFHVNLPGCKILNQLIDASFFHVMIPQMEVTNFSPEKLTCGSKQAHFEEPGDSVISHSIYGGVTFSRGDAGVLNHQQLLDNKSSKYWMVKKRWINM